MAYIQERGHVDAKPWIEAESAADGSEFCGFRYQRTKPDKFLDQIHADRASGYPKKQTNKSIEPAIKFKLMHFFNIGTRTKLPSGVIGLCLPVHPETHPNTIFLHVF